MVSGMAAAPSAALSVDKHFYIRNVGSAWWLTLKKAPENIKEGPAWEQFLISAHLPFLKQPQVPGYGAPKTNHMWDSLTFSCPLLTSPPHIGKALRDNEDSSVIGRGRPDLFIMKHYN